MTFFSPLSFAEETVTPPDEGKTSQSSPKDKSSLMEQQDEYSLQRHYPFYFAYGDPLSKLQISFKFPIVRGIPVYMGYTQLMSWALTDDSKPFKDMTYSPELFYRWNQSHSILHHVDFGVWGHSSNGKDGIESRSYDKVYVRTYFEREYARWILSAAVQVSYLYAFDAGNKDIQDYVGPVSLNVSATHIEKGHWVDKSVFSIQAIPGGKYLNKVDKGGYQLDWSFRLGAINIVPAFYIQYYHGFAETLLNYAEDVNQVRAGVLF